MVNSAISKEFIGRFGIFYKNENIIYAYDEITHGLYKFELGLKKVDLVIPSAQIYQHTVERIRGISKRGDEIILIPSSLDSDWVFYNVKDRKIRYNSPIKEKFRISDVITVEDTLFLIPFDIYNPIIIISLDTKLIINFHRNWFNKDKLRNENFNIWGASFYNHIIVFPIVNTKQIVCINNKKINVIELEMPYPILSVCVYEDAIWVLPVCGKKIYMVNLKGDILDEIYLSVGVMEIDVSAFIRIIAAEGSVFLLPTNGENICVYQHSKKSIVKMREEGTYLQGDLFVPLVTPYWGVVIENKMLHLLPGNFRYKVINLSSLENNEYELQYGDNINYDFYWKMIVNAQRNSVFRESKDRRVELKELFEFIHYSYKNYSVENNMRIGKQIWEVIR